MQNKTKQNKTDQSIKKENTVSTNQEMITWKESQRDFKSCGPFIFKFCQDYHVTVDEFDIMAEEFLKKLDTSEDYKDVKELKKHFVNWYAKKKTYKNGHDTNAGVGKKIEFDRL